MLIGERFQLVEASSYTSRHLPSLALSPLERRRGLTERARET